MRVKNPLESLRVCIGVVHWIEAVRDGDVKLGQSWRSGSESLIRPCSPKLKLLVVVLGKIKDDCSLQQKVRGVSIAGPFLNIMTPEPAQRVVGHTDSNTLKSPLFPSEIAGILPFGFIFKYQSSFCSFTDILIGLTTYSGKTLGG